MTRTKQFFFFNLLWFPAYAIAQAQMTNDIMPSEVQASLDKVCANAPLEYDIKFYQQPLEQDLSLSSQGVLQTQKIQTGEANSPKERDDERALAVFIDKFEIKTSGAYNQAQIGRFSCKSPKKITLQVIFTPTIYISREAQMFACTFKRIQEHEMKHYHISSAAFLQLQKQINTIIQPFYDDLPLVYNSSINYQQLIQERSKKASIAIQKYLEDQKREDNAKLDNHDNYLAEEKVCSAKENQQLKKLLF